MHELKLTKNRHTMVSIVRETLRVQEGFLAAPASVHEAIAAFVSARRRDARAAAKRTILAFAASLERAPRRRRVERDHPDDAPLAERLRNEHRRLNNERFGGALEGIRVRVSRRMKSRLGHYSSRRSGSEPEIVISRGHFRRHGFAEAAHTLLHEMVHQWQDERGLPVDHGAAFRAKAREVGAAARATRALH
ncbi:MAG: SprT-like domain-containing protein [Gemmatimonadales bacterium]